MLTKEKCGALAMLVFSIAYGYQATKMPLTFLAAQELFNSKTLPIGLAVGGIILSVLILILPTTDPEGKGHYTEAFRGKVWSKTIWLFVNMGVYSFMMPFLGFMASSIVFLVIGFYILGERRWILMVITAVGVVVGLWFLLSVLMGIYIAPGEIFYMLGVIDV